MSAVREVKYLRELHHPNIIEVRPSVHQRPRRPTHSASCLLSSVCARSLSLYCLAFSKLLDVFSSKTNLNLVLEFLDTDLEMIIKDRSLVFLPADIKSWVAMTFRGLEFCHRNFILHRVRTVHLPATASASHISNLNHILFYLNIFAHRTNRSPPIVVFEQGQDLKPNNLLIASDGQLKIADFGLARDAADPGYKMTCQVITRYGHFDSLRLPRRTAHTHLPFGITSWVRFCFLFPVWSCAL